MVGVEVGEQERVDAREVDVALERAQQLGLRDVAELARYVNLCCLWGVGFESKPGFEWAAAICAEPRLTPRLVLHQLLARALADGGLFRPRRRRRRLVGRNARP